jgi:hypothetical protein
MWAKPGGANFFSRAGFSLNRKDYRDEMVRMQAGCHQLRILIDQRIDLGNTCKTKPGRYNKVFFERIRRTAEDIYQSLTSSLMCSTSDQHDIKLELQHRVSDDLEHDKNKDGGGLQFTFVVPYHASIHTSRANASSSPSKVIRIQKVHATTISTPSVTAQPNVSPDSIAQRNVLRKPNRKRVQFLPQAGTSNNPTRSSASQGTQSVSIQVETVQAIVTSLNSTISLKADGLKIPEISSMCLALQKDDTSPNTQKLIGMLPDQKRQLNVISLRTATDGEGQSMVPLNTILSRDEYRWADRLGTAVTLASSIIQLPESSWQNPNWTKSDIVFAADNYKKVFLSRSFDKASSEDSRRTAAKVDPTLFVRNIAIFTLGLILIELCFGRSIDDLYSEGDRLPVDGNKLSGITRQSIASRLIRDGKILDERGPSYETAVRRCIYCSFDQRADTLEDEGLRRAMYEDVVALLEEELQAFKSVKLPMLGLSS